MESRVMPVRPYSIRFHESAEEDLRAIITWIAEDSPDAAVDFPWRVRVAAERLSTLPRQGRRVRARKPEIRRMTIPRFRNYSMLYVIRRREITVYRIVHGARDLGPILRGIQ